MLQCIPVSFSKESEPGSHCLLAEGICALHTNQLSMRLTSCVVVQIKYLRMACGSTTLMECRASKFTLVAIFVINELGKPWSVTLSPASTLHRNYGWPMKCRNFFAGTP